ncbi:Mitochodrial transcription termination factor-related [Macleaya cordata]|uniref:Mitochodrial transcription termination factor-related n=1 Tax=Macleaya cordata TaxID=56857 RepID=A0A200QTI4_MACCD|nr:Mitochodrial transcription termination factor-related [Macleaya cordata]
MGISGPILTNIITTDPNILGRSLKNKIIPSFNFLKSLIPDDIGSIGATLRRSTWILHSIETTLGPSISILRKHGVPDSSISKLVISQPRTLVQKPDQINKIVLELKEMSFSPSNMVFVRGFAVLSGIKKPAWEAKFAVFKSFGWSDQEIMSVFRKQPIVMAASVEKIRTSLDYFMNKQNWTQIEISIFPTVLLLGMEKRVIPRCSVTQVLLSKGLIKKKQMGTALIVAEAVFLKNFVIKYQKEVPELMKLYQSKMGILGLDIRSVESSLYN